ncbi:MAG: hypothetical protein A3I61_09015 [Acidobacteria bacterium RIFCSPLOWO2_02_FULL_68_18]|nr:MAG: hypothetical protein A3I61_09015 [Acidobacteria bacterium RIFCSPLOWO2_02_FULL_68_18]
MRRRDSHPPASEPRPIPHRITASSSEKTARYSPSSMVKWRNQTISSPIAANPESAMAAAVQLTGDSAGTPGTSGIRDPESGVRRAGVRVECRTTDPRSRIPGPAVLASTNAPSPATMLNAKAMSCVRAIP